MASYNCPRASKGTPGDAKYVTEIIICTNIRKLKGFTFSFQGSLQSINVDMQFGVGHGYDGIRDALKLTYKHLKF